MGIRLHKTIGYGLSDVETDASGKIADSRINPDTKAICSFDGPKVKDYVANLDQRVADGILEEHDIMLGKMSLPKETTLLSDAVTWDPDYISREDKVREKILIVTPVSMLSSWKRWDDPIDYAEDFIKAEVDNLDGQDMTTVVHTFENGHYPWNEIFMNAIDGKRIEHKHWDVWRTFDRYYYSDRASKDPEAKENSKAVLIQTAEKMGFDSCEEAKKNIVPWIPDEVRWLTEDLELFSEPNGYRHLRPMFYSFWG